MGTLLPPVPGTEKVPWTWERFGVAALLGGFMSVAASSPRSLSDNTVSSGCVLLLRKLVFSSSPSLALRYSAWSDGKWLNLKQTVQDGGILSSTDDIVGSREECGRRVAVFHL